MANRVNWYYRQRVTEQELDLALDQLEAADHALAADLGIFGIIAGGMPRQHNPVADLTIDLEAPLRAYDRLGQRIFAGVDQVIDCALDNNDIPTEVMTPGRVRWLGLFVRFARREYDERVDGNSQSLYFRRDESFELVVRMAPEGQPGAAPRVGLVDSELLICEVIRRHGQTQILDADLDLSRRQAFVFARGDTVGVEPRLWQLLSPGAPTVQASFDAVDAELAAHVEGRDHRHNASHIDVTPPRGLGEQTLDALLGELVGRLRATAAPGSGTGFIGSEAVSGTPHALGEGPLSSHIAKLLGWLNTHVSTLTNAHPASAIRFEPFDTINQSSNVQAAIQELWRELRANDNPSLGSALIGAAGIDDRLRYRLVTRTVREQLRELLGHLHTHSYGDDHDNRYARLSHNHDDRYLRQVYSQMWAMDPGETRMLARYPFEPDHIGISYALPDANGVLPSATWYVHGGHYRDDIWCEVVKSQSSGGFDFEIRLMNYSSARLFIHTKIFVED